jgi:hypothetical protein
MRTISPFQTLDCWHKLLSSMGAVLHLVVNPDNILADNLKLISQDGRKNIFVEFV